MKSNCIDELIRSRRKTVSLIVTRDARLLVRAPLRLPVKDIEKLIDDKKAWINQKKELAIKRAAKAPDFKAQEGGSFLFLGLPLCFTYSDKIRNLTIEDDKMLFPAASRGREWELIAKWYKKQAKQLLNRRLTELSQMTGIPYEKLGITSARQRWGSCSARNGINLTWRLIMATPAAMDYVIIHELCHVIHKNHSKDFWGKVSQIIPEFRDMRRWLKDNACILDAMS